MEIRKLSDEESILLTLPDEEEITVDEESSFADKQRVKIAAERQGREAIRSGFKRHVVQPFLSGIQDITSLIAGPIERTIGAPVVGPEGFEFLNPEEVEQRKREGLLTGIPGAEPLRPNARDLSSLIRQSALLQPEETESIFSRGSRVAGQTAALGPVLGRALGFVKAPAAAPAVIPAATRTGRILQKTAALPGATKRAAQKLAHTAGQTFAKAPVTSTVVETGLGFTAGSGGYVANKIFPDSDAAQFIGEIVGGVAPAVMPARLAIRASGGVKQLYRTVRHPFTEIGGRQRAAARAKRAIPPELRTEALESLDQPTTLDPVTGKPVLSPAQRTGEPGLLALERAVLESSEQLRRTGDVQIAQASSVIRKSLDELGKAPAASAEIPIKEAQDYLSNLLDTRLRISAQSVDERVAQLGPKASREQLNLIAREEIENALEAARLQENQLYRAIPEDTAVPFAQTQARLESFVKELGAAQQGDIPAIASRFLGKESNEFFGNNLPPGFKSGETRILELRALQSKLRQEARNARAGDKRNLNKARIADELANTITDDLTNVRAGQNVAKQISVAIEFSKNLNDRFSTETVAKILGRRIAGERVPAGLTLEQSIGITGPKAREALDDLFKAFDSPEAPGVGVILDASEDYLRTRFLQSAVVQGQLSVNAARRFTAQNAEILNRLPNVRRQIDEVIESGDTLAVRQRQMNRVDFDDPKVSKATMLIQKGPIETFRQISRLKPELAAQETQKLINLVSRDTTGEALSGLKSGFLEYLYSTSRQQVRDVAGAPFLSGFALRDALEASKASASRLFSKEELKRLDVITKDLVNLEKRRMAQLPAEGIIGDKPSKLVETLAGISGAAVGRSQARRLGVGGTVQIPGIMAERFRNLVKAGVNDPAGRLLRDMIFDEDLFRELLQEGMEEGGTKLSKVATRRLNTWAVVVAAEYGATLGNENLGEDLE